MTERTAARVTDRVTARTAVRVTERLRLRPGVYGATDATGTQHLLMGRLWPTGGSLGPTNPARSAVLRALAERPCEVAELARLTAAIPGAAPDDPHAFLQILHDGGWLTTTVLLDGRFLYTVQPLGRSRPGPGAGAVPGPAPSTTPAGGPDGSPPAGSDSLPERLVLSRFAVLHREGDAFVVESPLAARRLQVHHPGVASVLYALARPMAVRQFTGPLPEQVTARLLRDLHEAGLAVPDPNPEDFEPRLRQWSAHELWSHARTRTGDGGYSGRGFGRTEWGKGRFAPVPAREPAADLAADLGADPVAGPGAGPAVDLYTPDLDALRRADPPLSAVIEDRASVRNHDDDAPITADQLGELLYRCARVRGIAVRDGVEHLDRPYPSGGGAYELELYPVVRRVQGLAGGLYRYDGVDHRLRQVRAAGPHTARLLAAGARAAAVDSRPQVLIVVAARFGRLMRTYEEIPYSLILKHVGVLYQTFYLVGTAMGLAVCGLGAGDAAAFTEATGLDWATESSVGELALGSRSAAG